MKENMVLEEVKEENSQEFVLDSHAGFKIVNSVAGERFTNEKLSLNTIIFMLEGEASINYDKQGTHRLTAGEMFFVPAVASIEGTCTVDGRLCAFTFNKGNEMGDSQCAIALLLGEMSKPLEHTIGSVKMSEHLVKYLELIERYLEQGIMESRELYEIKVQEFFILLGYSYSTQVLANFFAPILGNEFRAMIYEGYSNTATVLQLSSRFQMSYATFLRKFKREFGLTAQQWLLNQRAKHIRHRMAQPNTKISDIVRDFGFADAPHFSRFAKSYYGVTPGEFMRKIRQKNLTA